MTLHLLALTETWITPENSTIPAAPSTAYSFSHSPRPSGSAGGNGLLILLVLPLEHLTRYAFDLLAVTVTLPIKVYIVVIYHPPGPFCDF